MNLREFKEKVAELEVNIATLLDVFTEETGAFVIELEIEPGLPTGEYFVMSQIAFSNQLDDDDDDCLVLDEDCPCGPISEDEINSMIEETKQCSSEKNRKTKISR
jgi:hypothetical protein